MSQKNRINGVSDQEPDAPRVAPPPEGPDEIDARVARLRKGFWGSLRQKLWKAADLDNLSPKKRATVLFVGAAEVVLIGLGFFTDLPLSWLATAGLGLLTLFIYGEEEDKENEEDEATETFWRELLRLPRR